MPKFTSDDECRHDPDFMMPLKKIPIQASPRKRKHRNSSDAARKRLKNVESGIIDLDFSDSCEDRKTKSTVTSPNVNGHKRQDNAPKMKTLDEIFANMKNPTAQRLHELDPKPSVEKSSTPVIVDLTGTSGGTVTSAPRKASALKASPKRKSKKSPVLSSAKTATKPSKLKLRIALKRRRRGAEEFEDQVHSPITISDTGCPVVSVAGNHSSAECRPVSDCEPSTVGVKENESSSVKSGLSMIKCSKKRNAKTSGVKISSNVDTTRNNVAKKRKMNTGTGAEVGLSHMEKLPAHKLSQKKALHPLMMIKKKSDGNAGKTRSKSVKKSRSNAKNANNSKNRRGSSDNTIKPRKSSSDGVICIGELSKLSGGPAPKSSKKAKSKLKNGAKTADDDTLKNVTKVRQSSSDGVICLGEEKSISEGLKFTGFSKKREENYGLSALPCETILWTEKYAPKISKEVTGNEASVEKLLVWLKEWRQRWEKEMEEAASQQKDSDSDSDFELDNEDKAELRKEERDLFSKIAGLIGPCGCGKTAAVFACAKELNFKVLEMNASSLRSNRQVLSQLHEATMSHQLSKSSAFQFFKVSESANMKVEGDSLILLKDADIIFEDDKHFWSAVDSLIADTKRPIVLTASSSGILANLEKKYEKIYLYNPSTKKQCHLVQIISKKEHFELTEDSYHDFEMVSELVHRDLRKLIHNLHFWGGGNDATNSPKTLSRGRKGRKRSICQSQKSKESADDPKISDVFAKFAGICDLVLSLKSENATVSPKSAISLLCSALLRSPSIGNSCNRFEILETMMSQMLFSSMPPLLRTNWWSLMLCYENSPTVMAGKTPLEIAVPKATVDADRDFFFDYSSDDCKVFRVQEGEPDVPEEDGLSGTVLHKTTITSTNDQTCKSDIDLTTLNILSKTADTMCIVDRIHNSAGRISKQNDPFSLDSARCKVSYGLEDTYLSRDELSYHSKTLLCDLQSSLEVRSIALSNMQFSKIEQYSNSTYLPDELSLRLPHEGHNLKSYHYLRLSLQSHFIGGFFATSQSFTTDFLPTIRCIVRSEQRRKEAKKCRRFMHYFDTIRVFLRPKELSRLLTDFKEVEILES